MKNQFEIRNELCKAHKSISRVNKLLERKRCDFAIWILDIVLNYQRDRINRLNHQLEARLITNGLNEFNK